MEATAARLARVGGARTVRQSNVVPSGLDAGVANDGEQNMGGYWGGLDYLGQKIYLPWEQDQRAMGVLLGEERQRTAARTFSCSAHGASRAGSMSCLWRGTGGRRSTKSSRADSQLDVNAARQIEQRAITRP